MRHAERPRAGQPEHRTRPTARRATPPSRTAAERHRAHPCTKGAAAHLQRTIGRPHPRIHETDPSQIPPNRITPTVLLIDPDHHNTDDHVCNPAGLLRNAPRTPGSATSGRSPSTAAWSRVLLRRPGSLTTPGWQARFVMVTKSGRPLRRRPHTSEAAPPRPFRPDPAIPDPARDHPAPTTPQPRCKPVTLFLTDIEARTRSESGTHSGAGGGQNEGMDHQKVSTAYETPGGMHLRLSVLNWRSDTFERRSSSRVLGQRAA